MKKRIVILSIIILLFIGFSSNVLAANSNFDTTNFENKTIAATESTKNEINSYTNQIITVVRIAGVAIAIVMLLVLAMKYMIAAPGDRAEIKKYAINYVIGAFILFGVVGILTLINSLASQITG